MEFINFIHNMKHSHFSWIIESCLSSDIEKQIVRFRVNKYSSNVNKYFGSIRIDTYEKIISSLLLSRLSVLSLIYIISQFILVLYSLVIIFHLFSFITHKYVRDYGLCLMQEKHREGRD